ncbi:hypothetical protein BDF20DRAFT_882138 [Mycotypha africana]|uniref:uncharacterized protein n=1 Tax=Mycotypha africana TaxID=64632 RepID=UPI0023018E9A|nr:uncharacterized protein BDF20DRAFT_882138 [Mycotypha africana]KAI8973395.1 hypothetical protein BDF20DRAFT_882138 [Mycotypha africana]
MTDKEDIELSEDDIVYYMFVLHDTNGDGYLDGNELREAFIDYGKDHQHDEGERKQKNIDKDVAFTLEDVTAMVDHILEEDDKNGDGLISWSEYLESRLYHTEA